MARIIYKKGLEGQSTLKSIEGIEIELLNGQKALIYPKYSDEMILPEDKTASWDAKNTSEIEALKKEDNLWATGALLRCGSPAAEYVSNFHSDKHGIFALPTLLSAMELHDQKNDIDELAETIDGADLLRNYTACVWSCSRCGKYSGWIMCGGGFTINYDLCGWCLAVPLVLYR